MSARGVDVLNIGLMLASCALAFALPFELFLFSYAVLGPLHYLTEISWLHQRGYFTTGRRDYLLLVGLCGLVLVARHAFTDLAMPVWVPGLNVLALGIALAVAFFRNVHARLTVILITLLAAFAVADTRAAHDALGIFLPTLIHVWVFTGAFILLGALRGRSATGMTSLAVFAACSAFCFLFVPAGPGREVGSQVASAYGAILPVNATLADWFGLGEIATFSDAFVSTTGHTVARFVAFAYTYHYLNWFSKTSIIQWHKIPRAWTFANIALWLAAVGLYAWDYAIGLTALFALSYLHVYLEFPLNHRTFVGIGRELSTLGRRAP